MPLPWNVISDRATCFAHDWVEAGYERGEVQMFWARGLRPVPDITGKA